MNLIAVTQRVVVESATGERRDALDQRWAQFLHACGLVPVVVPNHVDSVRRLLSRLPVQGVLLTGGNDLAAYGGDAPERDAVEEFLLVESLARSRPLLGVCRGMQLIQHFLGVPLERVPGHVAVRQEIVCDGVALEVNSYHEFGARETAPALEIRARAADGVIEAVRHRQRPVAGIMWHPERETPFADRDVAFVRDFFAGAGPQ